MITFIQMPIIDYEYMFQRPQQLMTKLSEKGNQVFYLEKNKGNYITKKQSNLYLVGSNYDTKNIKFQSPVILWCSSPDAVLHIDKIYHDLVVYDVIDEASCELVNWRQFVEPMIKRADIIFTSSSKLYNKFKEKHKRVYLINNGVDLNNFKTEKNNWPKDLPKGKKIVGYVGAVAPWIDWNLINLIIKESNYNFVFVGSFLKIFKPNLMRSNVYFLGRKEYEILPCYINNFDCCIIPFKINELTNGCNPIKLYEYLSLGKPIVTTSMKEVTKFKDLCYISINKEEFKINVDRAIKENNEKLIIDRKNAALGNSWDNRVETILKILQNEFNLI